MDIVSVFFILGAVLTAAGFMISWKWNAQLSLACTAFGAAFFGTACLLHSLHLSDVFLGSLSYLLALFCVFVASYKERKDKTDGEQP